MNSRSDWLKSKAEHYQHCYQRIENASHCLCLHQWPIFRIFTASSCTTRQLDKLSTQVLEIWTKCAKRALFESNNDIALNQNVIFCWGKRSAETDVW